MKNTINEKSSATLFVQLLFLGIFTIVFMKVWDGKKQVETKERDQAYSDRVERLNNAEQYALIANRTGFYPCTHCPKGKFFLNRNEVYKYGVTINGKIVRYTAEYLKELYVDYIVEKQGTVQECLEEEAKKIILYYQLPENAVRFDKNRLARPPGNSKDQ